MIAELQADGVLQREQTASLKEALRTSRQIGAAIGILMENRKVTEEYAFRVLVKASNDTNRKLGDIATAVVRTGDLSDLPQ